MTFKEARKKQGLTQKELEHKTGIHQCDISRIENDLDGRVNIRTLRRLAKALNMRLKVEFELCD